MKQLVADQGWRVVGERYFDNWTPFVNLCACFCIYASSALHQISPFSTHNIEVTTFSWQGIPNDSTHSVPPPPSVRFAHLTHLLPPPWANNQKKSFLFGRGCRRQFCLGGECWPICCITGRAANVSAGAWAPPAPPGPPAVPASTLSAPRRRRRPPSPSATLARAVRRCCWLPPASAARRHCWWRCGH